MRRLLGRGSSDDAEGRAPGDASALAGSYAIGEGVDPSGASYSGTVRIESAGAVDHVFWTTGAGVRHEGVGLVLGDTFAVGWGSGSGYGVVAYRIHGGVLEGTWATAGSQGETGREKLEGPPGLDGRYDIIDGKSPNGASYGGTVDIDPEGEVLAMRWEVGGGSYVGVGVRHGSLLVAAWGPKSVVGGVVAYRMAEGALAGPWASMGATRLGRETLRRR